VTSLYLCIEYRRQCLCCCCWNAIPIVLVVGLLQLFLLVGLLVTRKPSLEVAPTTLVQTTRHQADKAASLGRVHTSSTPDLNRHNVANVTPCICPHCAVSNWFFPISLSLFNQSASVAENGSFSFCEIFPSVIVHFNLWPWPTNLT